MTFFGSDPDQDALIRSGSGKKLGSGRIRNTGCVPVNTFLKRVEKLKPPKTELFGLDTEPNFLGWHCEDCKYTKVYSELLAHFYTKSYMDFLPDFMQISNKHLYGLNNNMARN